MGTAGSSSEIPIYVTDDVGDVHQMVEDGVARPFDPAVWGWDSAALRAASRELRRSVEALHLVPEFQVDEAPAERFVPGPRGRRWTWGNFADGHAPPAAVRSAGGSSEGISGYHSRLSEAVGWVVANFPKGRIKSPVLINDFVGGRLISVTYKPVWVGAGTVYVVEDGIGIKVGYTSGTLLQRINGLQTGNPRPLIPILEIRDVSETIEAHLHGRLTEWRMVGEWFSRAPLVAAAGAEGGFRQWIEGLLPAGEWQIEVHPPFR